jgi:glycosyltransferase involved in cell wall biosynthesis
VSKLIWHISSNRWNSAITEYCLSSARSLIQVGNRCHLTLLSESPAAQRARDLGLEFSQMSSFNLSSILKLRALYKELKPDLVITYGGPETSLVLGAGLKCPLVRFRGYSIPEPSFINKIKYAMGLRHVCQVVVPSKKLMLQHRRLSSVACENVLLGVDETRYSCDEEVTQKADALIFGRFDPIKGHREFLKIYKKTLELIGKHKLDISFKLHCVGNPENVSAKEIEREARALGLEDAVVVEGKRVSDGPERMRRALVGVVSSLGSEEICRVSQEFLMCGTYVFVSEAGSLNETLAEKADGEVFSMDDIDGSAEKLLQAVIKLLGETSSDHRERSNRAMKRMSFEAMGQSLNQVLFGK